MKSGSLAQLVEQLTFNQLVPSSSLGRSTTFIKACEYQLFTGFFCAKAASSADVKPRA